MNNKAKFLKNIKPTFDITTLKFKTDELELDTEYHSYNKNIKDIAANKASVVRKVWQENMPKEIFEYVKLIGLEEGKYCYAMNIQMPGQYITLHKDGHLHACEKFNLKTEDISRICIFLSDWHLGEVMCVEKQCLTDWKAGDIYYVPPTWHWSVNAGWDNKYTLIISAITESIPFKIL